MVVHPQLRSFRCCKGVYPPYACISFSVGGTKLCYSSKFAQRQCLYESVIYLSGLKDLLFELFRKN